MSYTSPGPIMRSIAKTAWCLIVVSLAAVASADEPAFQKDPEVQRGLVVCQDKRGIGFFRRGECPDQFFTPTCPPNQTCSDGICPDQSRHDSDFSKTACYAVLKDRLGHESRQLNYCEVTNLKESVGRARFPSGLLCWDRNCNGHCDAGGSLLTTEDLNGDGICSEADCREQCWDLNKNFYCDPDEDLDHNRRCTDHDCPGCWDTNRDLRCDLQHEDLNHDGVCDDDDCPKCWDTNRDLKCTLPDEDLDHDGDCDQDDCKTQCWDLNGNALCDRTASLNEDINGDGMCTIADCLTPLCSDRNHNGACDPDEDRNHDGQCNNLDCGRVRTGAARTAGHEGRLVPLAIPVGRATLIDIAPGRYDITATLGLSDDFVVGENVDCRIVDGLAFESTPRLAQATATTAGDMVLVAPMVSVNSGAIGLRCQSSMGLASSVRLIAHSTRGLRLIAEPLDDEP